MAPVSGSLVEVSKVYSYSSEFFENLKIYTSPTCDEEQALESEEDSFAPGSEIRGCAEFTPEQPEDEEDVFTYIKLEDGRGWVPMHHPVTAGVLLTVVSTSAVAPKPAKVKPAAPAPPAAAKKVAKPASSSTSGESSTATSESTTTAASAAPPAPPKKVPKETPATPSSGGEPAKPAARRASTLESTAATLEGKIKLPAAGDAPKPSRRASALETSSTTSTASGGSSASDASSLKDFLAAVKLKPAKPAPAAAAEVGASSPAAAAAGGAAKRPPPPPPPANANRKNDL